MLTGSLVDYLIPSAAEMPHIDPTRTVTPSPSNPMGVKGIGEAGTIAATAAVSRRRLRRARRPRTSTCRCSPTRVWRAMQEGGAQ